MKLPAVALATLFAGNAFGHAIIYRSHEIPHTHVSVELLLLVLIVAALAVWKAK